MERITHTPQELAHLEQSTGLVVAGALQIDAWTVAPILLRPERPQAERRAVVLRLNQRTERTLLAEHVG